MYLYNNVACFINSTNVTNENTQYIDFCYQNIQGFSFDKTFPENKTLFIIKDNIIISIFKLDVLLNTYAISCAYVNSNYYKSIDLLL